MELKQLFPERTNDSEGAQWESEESSQVGWLKRHSAELKADMKTAVHTFPGQSHSAVWLESQVQIRKITHLDRKRAGTEAEQRRNTKQERTERIIAKHEDFLLQMISWYIEVIPQSKMRRKYNLAVVTNDFNCSLLLSLPFFFFLCTLVLHQFRARPIFYHWLRHTTTPIPGQCWSTSCSSFDQRFVCMCIHSHC